MTSVEKYKYTSILKHPNNPEGWYMPIPPGFIEDLGWEEDEIVVSLTIKNGELVVKNE
jgi:hypothetical protein